ncbi:MAG: alpha-xylosidase [Eubacteriales bacterium]|nr:alpha-xylosidase [Eubacteriales bacterium]
MKFTEGYWLSNERAHALYAAQAYSVERIENGMRVVAPVRRVESRGDTLNLPTITIEFRSAARNVISVRAWHYEAYAQRDPRFEKREEPYETGFSQNEEEAVLTAGDVSVHVNLKNWGYSFWAKGKMLTSCSFHNLGYIRWDKKPAGMLPGADYMREHEYTPYMVNELSLAPGENVYGFGERFTAFVKNGQSLDTWNEDGGTASQVAYKNIPFYMTNRGYGVLVDHTDNVSFEAASEKVEYVGFSVPGEELRYYFFYGPSPKKILEEYTALTGRPPLPPAWSFGLWLSTSFTTDYDEKTVSGFLEGMQERQIPLSVFHFDCFWMKGFHWCDFTWDDIVFPDPDGMLKRYHEKGLKICVWINPYIAQSTPVFQEALEGGFLLMRADGRGVRQTDNWQAGMGIVDFTNPAAWAWYQGKLRRLLEMGVDCFKTDFGERIPIDVRYFDGSDPAAMHNYYTFLYNRCVFELIRQEKGEMEAVVFARSATAGSQQFPVHWGGDCSASYHSMAETLRGGLSFAMSGFSFWSHDIGGFESTASADVYKRWLAFGLLSSHSRLHGSGSYRVPWAFDEEACEVARHFAQLKCRLMPYLYEKAVEAHEAGTPVMRPMVFEFPDDPACAALDMQYMLGDCLLVAPVFCEEGAVWYYLPEGKWIDYFGGTEKQGGRYYRDTYNFFSLPLYVRENTLLAVGTIADRPDYDYAENCELHFYAPVEGKEAVCRIPDMQGNIVRTVRAVSREDKIELHTDDEEEKGGWNGKLVVHRGNGTTGAA